MCPLLAQWTSEIYYGKHDTTGGNVGDSCSAMGRIAWFDAKARKMIGDVTSFDTQVRDESADCKQTLERPPSPLPVCLHQFLSQYVFRYVSTSQPFHHN